MKTVYLFQVNYQMGHGQYTSLWLPYSIASIWAYVEQFQEIKDNFIVKDCVFKREKYADVIDRMEEPNICLFSHYLWNENYNLELSNLIKKRWPNAHMVFGGPQVDDVADNFLYENPHVDSVVINEGEVSLHKLLNDYLENNVKKIYHVERRVKLEGLPSPFTDSTVLQKIVDENPATKWATCIETNRGCPFACTFCDWGSLTQSKITKFDLDKIYKEWDWIVNNGIEYVHIADANFGVFYARDKAIVDYIVKCKKDTDFPHNVSATWYKNSAKKMIGLAKMLEDVNLNKGFTLSVQSMNEETLDSIERKNMEISKLADMYAECEKQDVAYYTEFILGLPFETLETWKIGLCAAIEAGCHHHIDIHPLEVLKNSEFAKQVKEFNYKVNTFTVLDKKQPSLIPERHNYVIASEFMTKQEYIDCWMFSWLILHFHHYAWTQLLARFAHKYKGLPYLQFYEDLFEQCISKDPFFIELYNQQENELKGFFWNTSSDTVFDNDNVIVVLNQIEWHKNRDRVQQVISNWARKYFRDLEDSLLQDLIQVNKLWVTNMDRHNVHEEMFEYNIPEYIIDNQPLIRNPVIYAFSNKYRWLNAKDFKDKLFYKNRNGFSIQKIERIDYA